MLSVADLVTGGLLLVGVVLAVVFAWFVWPPLVLAVASVGCVAAGLLIDWEARFGDSSRTPPKP